jgi:hypothetical protein
MVINRWFPQHKQATIHRVSVLLEIPKLWCVFILSTQIILYRIPTGSHLCTMTDGVFHQVRTKNQSI